MKEFIKYTLATITGTILLVVALGIISVITLIGMAAAGNSPTQVKENSVFALNLSGLLSERSSDNPFAAILGEETGIGLDNILDAIDKAKNNENIKGIYIEAGAFASDSPASSQAIRKKLEEFKKSGKWIIAYGDQYTQTTYYICSVADKVYINPIGMLDWHGLSAQPMFYKDLLGKFGVKVQLTKVGKYKSAPETYTADKMSDANREQVSVYMNNIWQSMLSDVSRSRKISIEKLNALADEYQLFKAPSELKKNGLVDGLLYADGIKSEIKKKLGLDNDDSINQLTVSDMTNVEEEDNKGDEIAVYYAYGSIVDAAPDGIGSTASYIVGDKVSKDLQDLADDDDVKAVVVRVNSGGGSAYASEQIWHAMTLLKEKKPVVVSMGGMAASGGYYMSCPANYIFAENTTITGSIGIFGMFPDFSGLLTEKLGVKFDEINTNKNSGLGTLGRPFSEEEMEMLNAYIGRGYELFRKRVADGRHLSINSVEEIAQGRVWTGGDALRIKLVDEIGGIDKAIAKAAKMAKIDEYYAASYPAEDDWMTQMLGTVTGGGNYLDDQLRATLGDYYAPFMYLKTINGQSAIQARLPYELVIK